MRGKSFVYAITVVTILGLLPSVCSAEETSGSGWGTAQVIETDDSESAMDPQVSVDGSGNAIAVWRQSYFRGAIWSNRYVVGTGWGTAQLIEHGTGGAVDPQVSMDSSGNATAVWQRSDGALYHIWSNRYVVGAGWGTPQVIETDDSGGAAGPQVSVDGSGNAIAVWRQSDGVRWNIWSNRYAVGTGWGAAQLIETDDSGSAWYPEASMDGSGNAIAVWYQSDGLRGDIWSNRYVVGTGWGTAQLIETDDSGYASCPQVSVDGSGNAIAVWLQSDGVRGNIWSNRYVAGTGWGTAQLIETDDSGDASVWPQVSVDGSGNAIAVWLQSDGVREDIWSNRYVAGIGWGTAQLIETDDSGSASGPQVSVDGSGNAIAVWYQSDGIDYSIWSNRYVVGVGWGDAQLIETYGGSTGPPEVAMGVDGNAIAVWRQWDGTEDSIWSNRFSMSDTTPPILSLTSPSDGMSTEIPVITVSGTTEAYVALKINGVSVALEPNGSFTHELALVEGANAILVTATDAGDNSASVSRTVTYVKPVLPIPDEVQVGVEAGDWIKLDYTVFGAPSGTPLPTWMKVEFLIVEGTNATVRLTMHMSNGTEISETAPVDIVTGGEALGLSGFVIPTNCTTGDSIFMSGYGNLTIAGETTRTYAGARRTVVHASFSQYGTELTYYWDKETGVMVEASTTSGILTATAKATETNMWDPESSDILSNPTALFALAMAICAVVAVVAFIVRRRRKAPPKDESPQP